MSSGLVLFWSLVHERYARKDAQANTIWKRGWEGQVLGRTRAERGGYESEAAFSRAFKREFDTPPATWRRAS
jgi:hypothetical protein